MKTFSLQVDPKEQPKLKKIIEVLNQSKNIPMDLVSCDGWECIISFENEKDIFKLGRAFQGYKLPMGQESSFTVNFDNSFINLL